MEDAMKMIVAYVQPERLHYIRKALADAGVTRVSITQAMGSGSEPHYEEHYRGADIEIDLFKKTRLEIAVTDDFVQLTIDAIVKGARTESAGDGKIFVLPVLRTVRIRTLEEGGKAVG
ncbi:MAG: nitrogen regulatory protein P-II 2 [Myxococcota bacterium]|jgi:nitrogen regulatory protein P-II 2